MPERFTLNGRALITGNTFPVKDQLRAMGGTWDKAQRGWWLPVEKGGEARALVAAAPDDSRAPRELRRRGGRRGYGSNYTRFSSGAEVYTNARGRCEDAPCCGCCS